MDPRHATVWLGHRSSTCVLHRLSGEIIARILCLADAGVVFEPIKILDYANVGLSFRLDADDDCLRRLSQSELLMRRDTELWNDNADVKGHLPKGWRLFREQIYSTHNLASAHSYTITQAKERARSAPYEMKTWTLCCSIAHTLSPECLVWYGAFEHGVCASERLLLVLATLSD